MARGIVASRKTPDRPPKVSRKGKEASRLPPPEDDNEATEDEDWIKSMRTFLAQNLIIYLTKTHLSPENQEVLKDVVKEYRDKLQRNVYRQHSHVDAWRKVIEKFNYRTRGTREGFLPDSDVEATPKKRKRKTKKGVLREWLSF